MRNSNKAFSISLVAGIFILVSQNAFAVLLYSVPQYHTDWNLTMEEACQEAGENLVAEYNQDPLYGVPVTLVITYLSPYYETYRCAITRTNYTGINRTVFLDIGQCTQDIDQGCVLNLPPVASSGKELGGSCEPISIYVGMDN
jgi:hypothetical protein